MAQDLLKLDSYDKTGQKTDWFEVLPLEADSDADRTSGLFIARFAKGVMFQVILDNEAGTAGGFTPKILVPNAANGGADLVFVTFTELTADGDYLLVLYPDATDDMGNEDLKGTLPREWKLRLEYTAGTPETDSFDTRVFARYI